MSHVKFGFIVFPPDIERRDERWAASLNREIASTFRRTGHLPRVPDAAVGAVVEADLSHPLRLLIRLLPGDDAKEAVVQAVLPGRILESSDLPVLAVPAGATFEAWREVPLGDRFGRTGWSRLPRLWVPTALGGVKIGIPVQLLTPNVPSSSAVGGARVGKAIHVEELLLGWRAERISEGLWRGGWLFTSVTFVGAVLRGGQRPIGVGFYYGLTLHERGGNWLLGMAVYPRRKVPSDWDMLERTVGTVRGRLRAPNGMDCIWTIETP